MLLIFKPQAFKALIADSLPPPGPLTFTSRLTIPNSLAAFPALSAAIWAAKGVLFLDPLNPEPPDVAQQIVLPCLSVIVTIVLLNDECMCATPSFTIFFIFLSFSCHIYPLIGFLGPFLVLALFLVFCPLVGNFLLCLMPL